MPLNRFSGTGADGSGQLGSSPYAGGRKTRNKVTVGKSSDGRTIYTKNGTLVANDDWRPDPGTDDVSPMRYNHPESKRVRGEKQ